MHFTAERATTLEAELAQARGRGALPESRASSPAASARHLGRGIPCERSAVACRLLPPGGGTRGLLAEAGAGGGPPTSPSAPLRTDAAPTPRRPGPQPTPAAQPARSPNRVCVREVRARSAPGAYGLGSQAPAAAGARSLRLPGSPRLVSSRPGAVSAQARPPSGAFPGPEDPGSALPLPLPERSGKVSTPPQGSTSAGDKTGYSKGGPRPR